MLTVHLVTRVVERLRILLLVFVMFLAGKCGQLSVRTTTRCGRGVEAELHGE